MNTNGRNILNYKRKDIRKVVRVIFQVIFLTSIIGLFCKIVFFTEKYNVPDKNLWKNHEGFAAVAFPGVSLTQQSTKITKAQLDEYLELLHKAGYIAISQQDIIDYYKKQRALPDKAIFILFDSGAKDSVQFIQPLLEKYQYIATCLTYAEKIEDNDPYFIQLKDIQKMKESGFWEFGTNGYRLLYINNFDKNSKFYPFLNQNEFYEKNIKYYNHYLMDFLRNEDMIPIETKKDMVERINFDYNKMGKVYDESFGFIPQLYILMNSNSEYYGSNKLVGVANYSNIERMFRLNFNREGSPMNIAKTSLFDLTRLQIQPNWYTNHFLMRFKLDIKDNIQFVLGDKKRAKEWNIVEGASEFNGNRIILTSPYEKPGFMELKDSEDYNDFSVNTVIPSYVTGKQSIYLRYDKNADSYIRFSILEDKVSIEEKTPGSLDTSLIFDAQLSEVLNNQKCIKLSLSNNKLNISINDRVLTEKFDIDKTINRGVIALASEYNTNEDNDKICDSIFDDFYISKYGSENKSLVLLYDNRFSTYEKTINAIKLYCGFLVNWFIEKL